MVHKQITAVFFFMLHPFPPANIKKHDTFACSLVIAHEMSSRAAERSQKIGPGQQKIQTWNSSCVKAGPAPLLFSLIKCSSHGLA